MVYLGQEIKQWLAYGISLAEYIRQIGIPWAGNKKKIGIPWLIVLKYISILLQICHPPDVFNKDDTVACGSVRTNCLSTLCHKSIGSVRCSLTGRMMGDIDDGCQP